MSAHLRCLLLMLAVGLSAMAEDQAWSWHQWQITAHNGLTLSSGAISVCTLGINDLHVTSSEPIAGGVRLHGKVGEQTVINDITVNDGHINCRWQVRKNNQPGHTEMMTTFAGGDLAGSTVDMDDEAVVIPRQFQSHEFRHARSYRLFDDAPGKRLRIDFSHCEFANLRDFRHVSGRSDLQLFALTDAAGDLELTIDLTHSADESHSEHFAGERYAWLDDLHLPPPTGANLLANPSFEGGLDQWTWGVTDWRDPPGAPVWVSDDRTAHSGTRSVRYTVHAGWHPRMLCTSPLVLHTNAIYSVSFWAKSDQANASIDVLSHFSEWGKFPLIHHQRLTREWTRYVVQVNAITPIAQFCFGDLWWRDKSMQVDGAHIWLDDIQVEEGPAASAFAMPAIHGASSTGTRDEVLFLDQLATTPLQITLTNASAQPATVSADVQIQDLARTPLIRQQLSAALPAWGASIQLIDLHGLQTGSLHARGVLRVVMTVAAAEAKLTFYGRIAVVERISDPGRVRYAQHIEQPSVAEAAWQQPLGVSGSLGFALPEEPGTAAALAAKDWLHITSPNGASNCPLDIFHTVPDEAGWAKYATWIADNIKTHPGTTWWKTFNEPNCGGLLWTPEDCVRGVAIMRPLLLAQDAHAQVLTPDCYNASRNGQAWLDAFLTAGGAKLVDAIAIHSYRARPEDPDLDHDIQSLIQLKARHGLAKAPILFTEGEGYAPHTLAEIGMSGFGFYEWRLGLMGRDIGRSEITAAALMQRTWLACLKNADEVKFYLSWMTDATDGQPRATLAAMNYVLGQLRHATFQQQVVVGDDTRCYIFEDPQHLPTAVMWSYALAIDRGENPPLAMVIPLADVSYRFADLMGNPFTPVRDAAGTHLAVSGWPIFIHGAIGGKAALIAACEKASIGGAAASAVAFSSRLALDGRLAVTATARLARPITGDLTLACGGTSVSKSISLAASGSTTVEIPLPTASTSEISATVISEGFALADGTSGSKPVGRSEHLRWFHIHRLANAVTIDGDAADWAAITPIALGKDALMSWGDQHPWQGPSDLSAKLRLGWRADGLYACVEVTDDTFITNQPAASAWQQDSLQLYLDLNGDGRDRPGSGYGNDDESISIAKIGGQDQLWRDYTPEWQIAFVKAGRIANGAVAIKRTGTVTTYEFRLPPDQVFPLRLQAGTTCGLALLINDDDGAGRQHALTLSPRDTEPHSRPELWPAVILVE